MRDNQLMAIVLINLGIIAIIVTILFAKFTERSLIARATNKWFSRPLWRQQKVVRLGQSPSAFFSEQFNRYHGYHIWHYSECIGHRILYRIIFSNYDNVIVKYALATTTNVEWSMEFNFNELQYTLGKDEESLSGALLLIHHHVMQVINNI